MRSRVLAGLVLVVGLSSCSDDPAPEPAPDASTSSSSSSGGATDGGGTSTDSGSSAADAGPINACTSFEDRSAAAASRTIAWAFPLPTPRCLTILIGQSVTFQGSFTQYRVAASRTGDQPNPIAGFDPDAPTVVFPRAGVYGFESPDAPALQGAVQVVAP